MTPRKRTDRIVVHCSATGPNANIGADTIRRWHKGQGWSDIGYHFVIKRDGTLEEGRREDLIGSHVRGHNSNSVSVCMVGGVTSDGRPANNFTPAQFDTLKMTLRHLRAKYRLTNDDICGHRDLSPDRDGDGTVEAFEWIKACPSFDVRAWIKEVSL